MLRVDLQDAPDVGVCAGYALNRAEFDRVQRGIVRTGLPAPEAFAGGAEPDFPRPVPIVEAGNVLENVAGFVGEGGGKFDGKGIVVGRGAGECEIVDVVLLHVNRHRAFPF